VIVVRLKDSEAQRRRGTTGACGAKSLTLNLGPA
jgi:hypothetical protein